MTRKELLMKFDEDILQTNPQEHEAHILIGSFNDESGAKKVVTFVSANGEIADFCTIIEIVINKNDELGVAMKAVFLTLIEEKSPVLAQAVNDLLSGNVQVIEAIDGKIPPCNYDNCKQQRKTDLLNPNIN